MGKYTFKKQTLAALLWVLLAGISGCTLILAGLYLYLSPKLPAIETLRQVQLQTPLRIYSQDNRLIGEFGEKRRYPITFENIPKNFIHAILAAEDDQFYAHSGVSIKGLLRAASQLLQSGHIKTGGSTITMQVARNFFLSRDQTFARKFNEILLALQIEQELSKQEILELYINKIYLGNRAYGIQAAAQVYYGQTIDQLTLSQLAMIAGLPKAPSSYNPIINPDRALIRRNWILRRMLGLGYIDSDQHQTAHAEPISSSYHGSPLELDAPYIAEQARQKAFALFGDKAYTEGYNLYTTVDSTLQEKAQQSVVKGLLTYDLRHGYRGPEKTLAALPEMPAAGITSPANIHTEDVTTENIDSKDPINTEHVTTTTSLIDPAIANHYKTWLTALGKLPVYHGITPAAVIGVQEQSAELLFADGSQTTLAWEHGIADSQRYITVNQRGPKPQIAADLLSVGDVIRVLHVNDHWYMSQIPNAQAALVSLNTDNGAILSMVGGFDFHQSHFNRATQAARQPGSNFKPFIYTAALEHGFTPATIMNDAPIVFDDAGLEGTWRPENASGKFFGPTRLRKALYKSRNLVSIRVLQGIGVNNALSGLNRFGFDTTQMPRDLSLALGSYALTPLQVATGYAVFANGGYRVESFLVESIEDVNGEEVFTHLPLTVCRRCDEGDKTDDTSNHQTLDMNIALTDAEDVTTQPADELDGKLNTDLGADITDIAPADIEFAVEQKALPHAPKVLDDQVAYIIDSMLRDVIQKGTGRKARALGRTDIAGKTGTTNGPRDAWFSGYSPGVITTTWLGFDRSTMLGRREYGGSAALPIWLDYMQLALKDHPEVVKQQPNGLVTVRINPETGERAQPGELGAIFEIFRQDNVPLENSVNNLDINGESSEELPEEIF